MSAMHSERVSRRRGKHQHGCLGSWDLENVIERVDLRKDLWVVKVREWRPCYPRDNGPEHPACCTDYRTRIKVIGAIITKRDAMRVSAEIARLASTEEKETK